MRPHFQFQILGDDATDMFEAFSQRVRQEDAAWRCLHATLPKAFVEDLTQRQIIEAFLRDAMDHTDQADIYWMATGDLFVFFQGPVRKAVKEFELFLNTLYDTSYARAPDYNFFWELDHFWGYYDEVLNDALNAHPRPIAQSARKRPLLLIVEDDRTTRHMLQAMMEQSCDIVVAWNAQQAEALYRRTRPSMAFLDIQIPYGDGEDLLKTLIAHDPHAFIVMVSGVLNPGRMQRCLDAGAQGCVAKPAREEDLLPFVEAYHARDLARTPPAQKKHT